MAGVGLKSSKSKYPKCELNEAVCDLLLMNVIIDIISLEI